MYCSRIPNYEVTCFGAHFDDFAAASFEPCYLRVVESMPIIWYLRPNVSIQHACRKIEGEQVGKGGETTLPQLSFFSILCILKNSSLNL